MKPTERKKELPREEERENETCIVILSKMSSATSLGKISQLWHNVKTLWQY